MLYDLKIKKEDLFVSATVSGMRSRKTIGKIAGEIFEACKKHKADRVVVDVRKLVGRMPIFDSLSVIFDEFPKIKQAGILKKAAIIDSGMRRLRYTFFERVARRRGYNLRIFSKVDDALEWITEDI
jgi:hypothetical protein